MAAPGADRVLQVGAALFGTGAAWVGAYVVYVLQSDAADSFWSPLGIVGVVLVVIGAIGLGYGLLGPDSPPSATPRRVRQSQRGGKNSRNVQVGGDFNIRPGRKT